MGEMVDILLEALKKGGDKGPPGLDIHLICKKETHDQVLNALNLHVMAMKEEADEDGNSGFEVIEVCSKTCFFGLTLNTLNLYLACSECGRIH